MHRLMLKAPICLIWFSFLRASRMALAFVSLPSGWVDLLMERPENAFKFPVQPAGWRQYPELKPDSWLQGPGCCLPCLLRQTRCPLQCPTQSGSLIGKGLWFRKMKLSLQDYSTNIFVIYCHITNYYKQTTTKGSEQHIVIPHRFCESEIQE